MPTSAFFQVDMVTPVDAQLRAFVTTTAPSFLCSQLFRDGLVTAALVNPAIAPYAGAATLGSIVAQAVGICPNEANEDLVLGSGNVPTYGGQCPVLYNIRATCTINPDGGAATTRFYSNTNIRGPVRGFFWKPQSPIPAAPGTVFWDLRFFDGDNVERGLALEGSGGHRGRSGGVINSIATNRVDAQPDNCGNGPPGGGQITTSVDTWPQPTPGSETKSYTTNIDYGANIGVKSVALPFSSLKIDKLFPLEFDVDVGGISFHYNDGQTTENTKDKNEEEQEEEDTTEFKEKLDAISELLEEIKECTCEGGQELDEVFLARADCSEEHEGTITLESIMALRGSVDAAMIARFQESAQEAKECCENTKPVENRNAEEIFSGVCTLENPVVFSPEIGLDVMSVVLEITSVDNLSLRYYKLAGSQSEAKFGHLGWSSIDFQADSDGPLCWSMETYFRLPSRTKLGRVRISLKPGLSFTLWDTGERQSSSNPGVSALSMAESEASIDSEV